MASGMTKTQLTRHLAEKLELNNKTAAAFLEHLADTAIKETKKNGVFVVPGLGRLVKAHAAALLGISRVSPQAGECYTESAGRARHLRGDADWRREVAVLPASGGDFGEDGGGGFSADRADAGPGGATGADGHSGGGDQ
jgi:DNA-binding protein HU-beta